MTVPIYLSGRWYDTIPHGVAVTSGTINPNTTHFHAFAIEAPVTINAVGCRINFAGSFGNGLELAIYDHSDRDNPGNPGPSLPLGFTTRQPNEIPVHLPGFVWQPFTDANSNPVTLTPGIYWSAIKTNDPFLKVQMCESAQSFTGYYIGSQDPAFVASGLTTSDFIYSYADPYGNDWNSVAIGLPGFTQATSARWAHIRFRVA